MEIKSAKFLISNTELKHCPKPEKPEYAFIGRSNVGKSSLINMLTNRNNLAKTSGTPGKTQLINHFIINESWYLVDLPGYGYAKISKEKRVKWEKMTKNYLSKRTNLLNTFILIDSRVPPQKSDLNLINWFGENQLPFTLIFTKADKLKKQHVSENIQLFLDTLKNDWEELPDYIITSAVEKTGRQEVLSFIEKTNQLIQ